jgi:hypothetical protein
LNHPQSLETQPPSQVLWTDKPAKVAGFQDFEDDSTRSVVVAVYTNLGIHLLGRLRLLIVILEEVDLSETERIG